MGACVGACVGVCVGAWPLSVQDAVGVRVEVLSLSSDGAQEPREVEQFAGEGRIAARGFRHPHYVPGQLFLMDDDVRRMPLSPPSRLSPPHAYTLPSPPSQYKYKIPTVPRPVPRPSLAPSFAPPSPRPSPLPRPVLRSPFPSPATPLPPTALFHPTVPLALPLLSPLPR